MIIDEGGRFQSVLSQEEIQQQFKKDLDGLSEIEKRAVFEILQDWRMHERSPLFEAGSQLLYERPPVSMETFLTDPYFLGKFSADLYPSIKEDLIEMFSGRYSEALIGGSIGAGKTTLAAAALLRMVYEISCLKDPRKTYNVASVDRIAFLAISVTEDTAKEIIGDKIISTVKNSSYFQEKFKPVKDLEHEVLFPHGIWIAPGKSTERATLGTNAFGVIIDESNFFRKKGKIHEAAKEEQDYAESIYQSVKRRMENRFMVMGRIPGMIIMISSKKSVNSFTEKRIRQSMNDSSVFVRERASYEVHPKERYSGEKFRVAIGNETTNSRILEDDEPDPDGIKVIEVPIEFKTAFEQDIDQAIRDIAGFATVAVTPYFNRRDKIYACCDKNRRHPFNHYIWMQDEHGQFKWSEMVKVNRDGVKRPILNPNAPRHVHIDLSKNNDATGIVMGHVGSHKEVCRQSSSGSVTELAPMYYIDFILRIEPPKGGEILHHEIRRIIYELSNNGYFIKTISMDQYQSVGMMQTFGQKGYHTQLVSMDRLKKGQNEPYTLLKNAIFEERINMYKYKPILEELYNLEKDWRTGKIDHPVNGRKDTADSLAGVIFTLHKSSHVYEAAKDVEEQAITGEDDIDWILNGQIVVNNEGGKKLEGPRWRQEAEKKLQEKDSEKSSQNWRENFIPPIEMG